MTSKEYKSKKQMTAVELAQKIQEIQQRRQEAVGQLEELEKNKRLLQLQDRVRRIDEELDSLLEAVVACV